uniref:Uncharacterized protein n=1 Tax=Arundo donax TaxID=35708 RepID=A0A0A9DQX3_ARUDO
MVTVQQQLYLGLSIHSTVHPHRDAHSGTNSPLSVEPALNHPPFHKLSCRNRAASSQFIVLTPTLFRRINQL